MAIEPTFQNPYASHLYQRIISRTARASVIGLGYAGLPMAVELSRSGFDVIGVDIDGARCDAINRGESSIPDVSASDVSALTRAGRLRAVTALSAAEEVDTVNICVPTPLRKTKEPDLSHVFSATHAVKECLRPGMLVILESTTYPGTTEELLKNVLEETGLKAGADFFLAFSPERVDPGNRTWTTRNVPKVVGGLTADCSALAAALYRTAVDEVVTVSSPRTAEMVKLLENTFRAINIGLVNELALMCDRIGISVWEVIDAAATKPFGFMPFYPGPGLGGHCIPVDPFYLAWKVREVGLEPRFIDLAGKVNAAMPHYVIDKIRDALNDRGQPVRGSRVLLIGVAYKAEVGDVRESPALDVITLLNEKGATVSYHDPFVPILDAHRGVDSGDLTSVDDYLTAAAAADCVVILTDHEAFDFNKLASVARLIVDTRNAIKREWPNVVKLGAPNSTTSN